MGMAKCAGVNDAKPCKKRPQPPPSPPCICPMNHQPVCDKDGTRYSNTCKAVFRGERDPSVPKPTWWWKPKVTSTPVSIPKQKLYCYLDSDHSIHPRRTTVVLMFYEPILFEMRKVETFLLR